MRKHFTDQYIILEFDIKNNTDCDIQKMKMEIDFDNDEDLSVDSQFGHNIIREQQSGKIFVNFKKKISILNVEMDLKFVFKVIVKEDEKIVNEYEDDFHLETLEIQTSDFFS